MERFITRFAFVRAFGLSRIAFYRLFIEKLNKTLSPKLHPSAAVTSLFFVSKCKDAGANTHAVLEGTITWLGHQEQLGGEFVWLRNLKTFRGTVWSTFSPPSDLQLLIKARDSYRRSEYREAQTYLKAIQRYEDLPQSAVKLKLLV